MLLLIAGGIGVTPIMGFIKDAFRYGVWDPKLKPKPSLVEKVVILFLNRWMINLGIFSLECS